MIEPEGVPAPPLACPAEPSRRNRLAANARSEKARRTERHSVLVVEDEMLLAMDLAATLEEASFEVVGLAASAEQALAAVEKRVPDVVLMDIRLKGSLDGVELARRLKQRHDLSIVYLTAHSDTRTRRRADETEPVAYLLKPFTQEALIAAVREAASRK